MLVGYPCTSISGLNQSPASFKDANSRTGLGFKSLVAYLDRNLDSVEIVVAENVAALSSVRKKFDDECPIQMQTNAFRKRGFVGWSKVLDARSFGLAQSRQRTWAVYIRQTSIRT